MNATNPKITFIEPTKTLYNEDLALSETRKKRVAAYARVSTDQEEQEMSYEAQCRYYERYIRNNPEWEYAGIYADEGISGTSTKNRDGFKRMIEDAKAGKIDLIITKSISRFARNTLDTLTHVRDLKALGVEVYFEKENIYTLDSKSEVILTIFGSLAQEESRSISENVRWGHIKANEEGRYLMRYKNFLGYRKGDDGKPEIVEEEAEIVRTIYRLFLEGYSIRYIATHLTDCGIPTPAGKKIWSTTTVKSILSNEKYKGDALTQKTYVSDFLTKKTVKNTGQLRQCYIHNSHPAIIDADTFDAVQYKLQIGTINKTRRNKDAVFCRKIICEDCGGYFGHKVWNDKKNHRYDVWCCNHKYAGKEKCTTPNLREEAVKRGFVMSCNKILKHKNELCDFYTQKLDQMERTDSEEKVRIINEISNEKQNGCVKALDHYIPADEIDATLQRLSREYTEAHVMAEKAKLEALESSEKKIHLKQFVNALKSTPDHLTAFDASLCNQILEKITVTADTLTYHYYDGSRVTEKVNLIS